MQAKQQSRIEALTNTLALEDSFGPVSFSVEMVGSTAVFHATNTVSDEFVGYVKSLVAYVGPRGGLKVFHAEGFCRI